MYKALAFLYKGSLSEVASCWRLLKDMWDGYGFRDEPWNKSVEEGIEHPYETYKLGLALYLARALRRHCDPLVREVLSVLCKL